MNAQQEAVAFWKFLEERGVRPSIRKVVAMMRLAGIGIDEADAARWLAAFVARAPHPKATRTKNPARPLQSSSTPAVEIQHTANTQPALYAGGLGISSLESPPTPSASAPAAKVVRIRPAIEPVVFEPGDEARVQRLLVVAARRNKNGAMAETRALGMRAELRQLLDDHGREAWRHGVDAGIPKGSVPYAAAVMRGYRSDNRAGPETLFSNIRFANEGNADDAIAAARAKATRRS